MFQYKTYLNTDLVLNNQAYFSGRGWCVQYFSLLWIGK